MRLRPRSPAAFQCANRPSAGVRPIVRILVARAAGEGGCARQGCRGDSFAEECVREDARTVKPDRPDFRELGRCLRQSWDLRVKSTERLDVGFPGSYHYAVDTSGDRFFVTVDDLHLRRRMGTNPEEVFAALERALQTTRMLRDEGGLEFVLAPQVNRSGRVTLRTSDRWAVTVFPFVAGSSSSDGSYASAAERREVLACLGRLHATNVGRESATRDGLEIPLRAELMRAIEDLDRPWTGGPFSETTRALLARSRDWVMSGLDLHDALAQAAETDAGGWVMTHGEPHGANTLRGHDGSLFLVDWETVAVAPRERDLWMVLDHESREDWSAYAGAAGAPPVHRDVLRLYRLSWQLSEIAEYVDRFRRNHEGSPSDRYAWGDLLQYLPASGTG